MQHKIKHIHFVGIGGVGMSGIAEVLFNLGYTITGSDSLDNVNTAYLKKLGIRVAIGHNEDNIQNAQVVVISSAISQDNIEVESAQKLGIPIVPRAMMLAELMRFKHGIAIAGTHGKTTTTSICAEVFNECGLDPTFIIGGKLSVTNSNAKLGNSEYLIAEADESDASFLHLNPMIAVVTNIDLDHMNNYSYDDNNLKKAFIDFIHRIPFYGLAILCNEDKMVREIIPLIKRPIITYGFSPESDIYAKDIVASGLQMHFTLCVQGLEYPIILNTPGEHNVLNSLAVIAVAVECGGKIEQIAQGLKNFHGVARRCQVYPNITFMNKEITLIDDYAHHPTEIKATLNALKNAYPTQRLVLIFQPHRYSRTYDLFYDFVNVLSNVEQLILLEVFSAGEKPIPISDTRSLIYELKHRGVRNIYFAQELIDAKKMLVNVVKDNDIVVLMGAGSVARMPQMLITRQYVR